MARLILLALFILSRAGFLPRPGSAWGRIGWLFFLLGLMVTAFLPELKRLAHDWKLFLTLLILIVANEAILSFLIGIPFGLCTFQLLVWILQPFASLFNGITDSLVYLVRMIIN